MYLKLKRMICGTSTRMELQFKGKGWKPVRPKAGTKNIWQGGKLL